MREERLYEQVVVEISGRRDEWRRLRELIASKFATQVSSAIGRISPSEPETVVTISFSGTRGEIHKLRAIASKVAREQEASVS